jgi:ankyrin repeat protein
MPDVKFDDAVMKLAQFGELDDLRKQAAAGTLRKDEQDDRGFTVVAWSARNGHMEVLEFLIAENHNIEIASFGGLTRKILKALEIAAQSVRNRCTIAA